MPMLLRQSQAGGFEGGEDTVRVLILSEPAVHHSALRIEDVAEGHDVRPVPQALVHQPGGGFGSVENAGERHAVGLQKGAGDPPVIGAVEAENRKALALVSLVQLLETADFLTALGRPVSQR